MTIKIKYLTNNQDYFVLLKIKNIGKAIFCKKIFKPKVEIMLNK